MNKLDVSKSDVESEKEVHTNVFIGILLLS